jgi:hydrogenase maturation protease
VVGVGSPFGDDRVGWDVVEALEKAWGTTPLPIAVRTCILDRPGAALIEALQGARHVVIVDAALAADIEPGALQWLDQDSIEVRASASSHGFGLAQALALARAIGAAPARIDVLAIPGARFEGETLSQAVAASVPTAVRAIEARLLAAADADSRA